MVDNIEKFNNAFSFHKNCLYDKARDIYLEILKSEPNNAEVLDLLGILYHQTNNYIEAELCIKKAIDISPKLYYVQNLAKLYLDMGKFSQAVILYNEIIKISKTYDDYFNLGLCYKGLHEIENSKKFYYKALEINPEGYEAHFNLAYLSLNENKPLDAIEHYKNALNLRPDDWETKYFLSLAYMQAKEYKKGLPFYESRLCRKSAILSQKKVYPNLMKKPIWRGEDIKEKTIYTYYEAGFGDVLMFYRYILLLTKLAKKIIIKPQIQLVDLFKENSYGCQILDSFEQEKDINFDYHIPLLSLPYVMNLDSNDIFLSHDRPYLKSNIQKKNYYKSNYCDNNKLKIGIKWQGNAHYDKERILNVEDFFILFNDNIQFYSFQTLEGSEELNKFKDKYNIIDLGSTFNNFSDTAGALDNMDLIISNDTSLVHLAGAMMKQTWVLLPYIYNWRWHTDLTKCDWYDSVKIYRQPYFGDWKNVFLKIKCDLEAILKEEKRYNV